MLEKTNALDVYFEDQIQILVTDPELHPVDAVGSVLEAKEIEFSKIEKSSAM